METVVQDIRYAVRTLAKQRGFTTIAVLCLALGIGVNTVIFSCLNAILLRPFPYANPDALVVFSEGQSKQARRPGGALSYPDYVDYSAGVKSFSSVGAYASRTFTLTGITEPERIDGARVSASMFPTLGLAPARGRRFEAADDREGAPRVALISDALWERRYARDPQDLGRSIEVDGRPATIVGVMPPDVRFPGRADMWLPHAQSVTEQRDIHFLQGIGRLAPGASIERARAELDAVGRAIYSRSVWQQRLYGTLFTSFAVIALMLAAVGVYSVIAYSVTQRQHEIGVRMALGARRLDVFRLVVQGGARLACVGVGIGTIGAFAATRVLDTLLYGVSSTDPLVFGSMAALLLTIALVASYLPARRAASLDPVRALKND